MTPHNNAPLCCVSGRILIPLAYCIMKSQIVAQHVSVGYLDSYLKAANVNLNKISRNHLFQFSQHALTQGRSMEISPLCSNKILMWLDSTYPRWPGLSH